MSYSVPALHARPCGFSRGTVVVSTPIWKSRIAKFAAGLVFICLLSSPAFALPDIRKRVALHGLARST